AQEVCAQVAALSEKDFRTHGHRRVFLADELFIRAGESIPARAYYEDFPQIENGVGLVRLMLDTWRKERNKIGPRKRKTPKKGKSRRVLVLTSMSAHPYIEQVAGGIEKVVGGVSLDVVPVKNRFLGESVTVAGLMVGADIIRTARSVETPWDELVIPAVCLNHRGYTLDGFSVARLSRRIGKPVRVAGDIEELVGIAQNEGKQ
ncbi:MAG: DUF512 domain-containing protein, partial [Chitinivibrionales bacterium]|nr:DUF512 domain-containing protein [Chitinivibrionales bacterium]MBD3358107.1 DUF512 domain-containing protein [Chitinivibrionales bacterium]